MAAASESGKKKSGTRSEAVLESFTVREGFELSAHLTTPTFRRELTPILPALMKRLYGPGGTALPPTEPTTTTTEEGAGAGVGQGESQVHGRGYTEHLVVLPTCQHAGCEMVRLGVDVEAEKDRLLEAVSRGAG